MLNYSLGQSEIIVKFFSQLNRKSLVDNINLITNVFKTLSKRERKNVNDEDDDEVEDDGENEEEHTQ